MWLIPTQLQICTAFVAGSMAVFSEYLFGTGIEKTMPFLVFFIGVDYLTGSIAAIKNKELSSNVGFYGLIKKFLLFILVIIGQGLDTMCIELFKIETSHWVRDFFVVGIVAMELISITENLVRLDVPIPAKIKELLALYHTSKKHNIPEQTHKVIPQDTSTNTEDSNTSDIENNSSDLNSSNEDVDTQNSASKN